MRSSCLPYAHSVPAACRAPAPACSHAMRVHPRMPVHVLPVYTPAHADARRLPPPSHLPLLRRAEQARHRLRHHHEGVLILRGEQVDGHRCLGRPSAAAAAGGPALLPPLFSSDTAYNPSRGCDKAGFCEWHSPEHSKSATQPMAALAALSGWAGVGGGSRAAAASSLAQQPCVHHCLHAGDGPSTSGRPAGPSLHPHHQQQQQWRLHTQPGSILGSRGRRGMAGPRGAVRSRRTSTILASGAAGTFGTSTSSGKEVRSMCGCSAQPPRTCTHTSGHTHACTRAHTQA